MKTLPKVYTWHSDPGHAWLQVPAHEVRASGARISRYSYASPCGEFAYLEEDCDASAFLQAIGSPAGGYEAVMAWKQAAGVEFREVVYADRDWPGRNRYPSWGGTR